MYIQDWINNKLKEIAIKLPDLVENHSASFACGFSSGYKSAMLDLDNLIEDGAEIFKTRCKCGDKYHGAGEICL